MRPLSTLNYKPQPGLPRVLTLDDHLLVADKPAGLLSVPGRLPEHHDSALLRLQAAHGPLWVVHRLDMDTSGLIVYARSREAAAALGLQFEARRVHKRYEALVWGCLPSRSGLIDLPLRMDWPHRPRQIIDPLHGKPSQTRYETIGFVDTGVGAAAQTRLALYPLTGRSHQLRVHLSSIGHPIVGDRFYGRAASGEAGDRSDRLMLHARELALRHPATDERLGWSAEAPF